MGKGEDQRGADRLYTAKGEEGWHEDAEVGVCRLARFEMRRLSSSGALIWLVQMLVLIPRIVQRGQSGRHLSALLAYVRSRF